MALFDTSLAPFQIGTHSPRHKVWAGWRLPSSRSFAMTPVSQLQWWSCRNLSLRQHIAWRWHQGNLEGCGLILDLLDKGPQLRTNSLQQGHTVWHPTCCTHEMFCGRYLNTSGGIGATWRRLGIGRLGPALSGPMANLLAAMAFGTLLELLNLDPIGLLQTSLVVELARLFQLVQFLLFLLPAHCQYVGYLMLFIGVLRFCCRIQTAMFGEEQFHIIKLHLWLSLEDLRRLVHGSSWFNHMGANCSALGHYIVGEAWPHGGGHSVELQIALGTGKYDCPLFLIHATAL